MAIIRLGLTFALTCAILACVSACSRSPEPVQLTGPAMGTTYSVSVPRLPEGVQRTSIEAAITEVLAEADQHLSGWNPASELVRFNSAASTEWQPVTPILHAAAEQAAALSQATGGAFDVTVGPLVRAWGFGARAAEGDSAPTAADIEQLLGGVGYAKLELRNDPPALRKAAPGLSIDLDGIAPGWAVDRVAQRFEALGIRDYLVELGGEIRARGFSAEGRRWRIAVETPTAGERRAFAVIEVDGVGVSTSGDYRDYREVNGQRISHTIDPRTGRPVAHGLASVTVVHESAAEADAWATALMVLGPEAGMVMARQRGLAALFIVRGATSGTFIETSTPEFAQLRLAQAAGL